MNLDPQKHLYAKYPAIFRNKDKSMQESCMYWGVECGDGWYHILDHMCAALESLYSTGFYIGDEYIEVQPPQVVMDQVKEKFGTLRVYHHLEFSDSFREQAKVYPDARRIMESYSDYVDGIIHMAEIVSSRTCEDTGKPGEMHVSGGTRLGWYRTLNREYAKTDPKMVARNYVPVADLPQDGEESS